MPARHALPAVALAVGLALAGCTALPAAHPPPDLPEQPPRLLCSAEWEQESVTLTVTAGHTVTADLATNLTVAGTAEGRTPWASTVAPEAARAPFPVGPGDSVRVAVDSGRDEVRVVAAGPDYSATLCRVERGGL